MCYNREILAALLFGLAPVGATLVVLLTTECRAHVTLDVAAWKRIIGWSLLLTLPCAMGIKLLQDWLSTDGDRRICLSWGVFLVGAFMWNALLMLAGVGSKQVKAASGFDVAVRYRGRWFLVLFAFALVFFVVRLGVGFLLA